jgi:YD repeat-containing protein
VQGCPEPEPTPPPSLYYLRGAASIKGVTRKDVTDGDGQSFGAWFYAPLRDTTTQTGYETRVLDPAGNMSVWRFHNDASNLNYGRTYSQDVYRPNPAGGTKSPHILARSVKYSWVSDGTGGGNVLDDASVRLQSTITFYADDCDVELGENEQPSQNGSSCGWVETFNEGWDGFQWRVQGTRSSRYLGGPSRAKIAVSHTAHNLEDWIIGMVERQTALEFDLQTGEGGYSTTDTVFDRATGKPLSVTRRAAPPALDTVPSIHCPEGGDCPSTEDLMRVMIGSGDVLPQTPSSAGAGDVVTEFEYDAKGQLVTKIERGGESDDAFTTRYTYEFGTLKTEKKDGVAFFSTDRVLHPTGLVLSSTSASGFTVDYEYDALNRITRIVPEETPGAGQEAPTEFFYPTPNYARIRKGDAEVASRYDATGRVTDMLRVMDDGRVTRKHLQYDFAGQVTFTSEWFESGLAELPAD